MKDDLGEELQALNEFGGDLKECSVRMMKTSGTTSRVFHWITELEWRKCGRLEVGRHEETAIVKLTSGVLSEEMYEGMELSDSVFVWEEMQEH
jgi:hypothetical protein